MPSKETLSAFFRSTARVFFDPTWKSGVKEYPWPSASAMFINWTNWGVSMHLHDRGLRRITMALQDKRIQCESKSTPPLKLFEICLFRLSIFPWSVADLLPVYAHRLTNFGQFNLIFNKMALIFLGVYLSFLPFQQIRLLWLHR